jgi:hypothetical protein
MGGISTLSRHTIGTMSGYAGIVHHPPDKGLLHLPLQEVDVRVWMVDGAYVNDCLVQNI